MLKTLRAERQFEEEQAGRRPEGKEAKAERSKEALFTMRNHIRHGF